jgi:hypothetical protein
MPGAADDPLGTWRKFQIPNTVIAFWAGVAGETGKTLIGWESDVQYLKDRKFKVVEPDNSNKANGPSDFGLLDLLKQGTASASKTLQGIFLWSHGNPRGLGNKDLNFTVSYANCVDPNQGLKYKLGLVIINACDGDYKKDDVVGYRYWDTSGLVPILRTGQYKVPAGGRDLAVSDAVKKTGVNVKFFGKKGTLYPIGIPNPFQLRALTRTDFKHVRSILDPGEQGTKK